MKIKILKKSKNELKIEIEGEGHTFCNLLQKTLLRDKRVDMAGYHIKHPLTENPVLYINTKARSKPDTVLLKAVEQMQKDTKDSKLAFEKALKEIAT